MNPLCLGTVTSALLVWTVLVLVPMVPGGLVDTRDFGELPRWQFRVFNVVLTGLGGASLVTAWFALSGTAGAFGAAIGLGLGFVAVFGLDLAGVFPDVASPLPTQLLVLEVLALASAGVLVVVAGQGLRV